MTAAAASRSFFGRVPVIALPWSREPLPRWSSALRAPAASRRRAGFSFPAATATRRMLPELSALQDQRPISSRDVHQFKDALPAAITGAHGSGGSPCRDRPLSGTCAPYSCAHALEVGGGHLFLAVLADHTHQPLGQRPFPVRRRPGRARRPCRSGAWWRWGRRWCAGC